MRCTHETRWSPSPIRIATAVAVLAGAVCAQEPGVPVAEGQVVGLCYGEFTSGATIGSAGDLDLYFFQGQAGDQVRVTVNGTSNFLDPRVDVRDPFNVSIAGGNCQTGGGPCNLFVEFSLPTTGAYTILVDEVGNTETGGYVLDLQRVPPPTPEPFLAPSVPTDVVIDHPGDHDYLRFVAEAGSEVFFSVAGQTNFLDPSCEIFESDGTLLYADSCSTGGGPCAFQFSAGGPNAAFDFPGQVGSIGVPGEMRLYIMRLSDVGLSEQGTIRVTMTCVFSPSLTCPAPQPSFGPVGTNYCTANTNSTGLAATISALGSSALADDDFHLMVQDAPAGMSGFFLFGPNQGFIPLFSGSHGNLCLAAPFGRFPLSGTCGLGGAHLALDLPNLSQGFVIQPGSTWNFQMWFRDNDPMPTSNTTDALSVTFQ